MNQTFINHVHELRRRLSWSALVLFIGAGLGLVFRMAILKWLEAPLHSQLYYGKVTGAFEFIMQIAFFVGLCFSLPMLVYQMISFIRPALPRSISNRLVLGVVVASSLLTIAGVSFAYYVSLPPVLHFLNNMSGGQLSAIIMADSYLNFLIMYLGIFAVVFQLPLLLLFIDRFTPLTPKKLGRWRKWVVVGSFAAALILPITPDPLSQMMLALPVVVLYELSIWMIWTVRHFQPYGAVRQSLEPVMLASAHHGKPSTLRPAISPPARVPRPVRQRQFSYGPQVLDLREHKTVS